MNTRKGLLIAALLLVACQPSDPSFADSGDESRPLLHFDTEYREGQTVPLSVARLIDGKEVRRFPGVFDPAFSPLGDEFAFMDGALNFVAMDGTRRMIIEPRDLKTPGEQFYDWHPTWSLDGTRIAAITVIPGRTVGDSQWAVVVFESVSGHQLSRHPIPHETAARCPYCEAWPNKFRWSPDGTRLLLSWGNTLFIEPGKVSTQVISDTWSSADWGPSSDTVYFFEVTRGPEGFPLKGFYAANLETGKRERLMNEDSLAASGFQTSALFHVPLMNSSVDGSHLVINSRSKSKGTTLRFYDLAKQSRPDLGKPDKTMDVEDIVLQLVWAPSGNSMAAFVSTGQQKPFRLMKFDQATSEWTVVSTLALAADTPPEVFAFKLLSWVE